MRVLDRHIFSSLTTVFALVLTSLLLLFFSVLILRYSSLISDNHQVLSAVVAACLVGIPMHVSFFLPPATGAATFFCMRTWQREGTWLGAIASGYDRARWRRPFLLFALLCTAMGWLFTLWLGPNAARVYYMRFDNLDAERFFLSTEPRRFVRLTRGVQLWVDEKTEGEELRNIILTIDRQGQKSVVAAPSGRLLRSEGGLMLEAHNGAVLIDKRGLSQTIKFERLRYGLEGLIRPQRSWQRRWQQWTRLEMPTSLLWRQMTSDGKLAEGDASPERQQQSEEARREFALRLAYPLLAPVYVLAIFAICSLTSVRAESRWSGFATFLFLLIYSIVHIYAVTLSARGGASFGIVFALSAAALLGAYALTARKATL